MLDNNNKLKRTVVNIRTIPPSIVYKQFYKQKPKDVKVVNYDKEE